MNDYWVFGASKTLGSALVSSLSAEHRVTSFSRSASPATHANHTGIMVDFTDPAATQEAIENALTRGAPRGVAFCQRFRPSPGQSDFDAFKNGLDVELQPVLLALNALSNTPAAHGTSIVLLSSVSGLLSNVDLPLHYQLLKATTVAATRALAALHSSNGLRVNCVYFGEYEKFARSTYDAPNQRKFEMVEQFSLGGRLCTPAEIVQTVGFLLSDQSKYLTGQIIGVDGGLSNIAQESILRQLAKDSQ